MEQCDESLRKRGVVKEDRISDLSESLLLQILSCLPTKAVVTTSVLSKRWRSLWKVVPKLEFETYINQNIQKFSENLGRFLLSHKAPVLESLHLKFSHNYDAIDIGLWAGIAFTRNLREFVLDLFFEGNINFLRRLFSFSNTLDTLKLKNSILLDVHPGVCMKSLRTLHLHCVDFKDNESFRNFISGCPNLENLVMCRGNPKKVLAFVIVSTSLKRLSIKDETGVVNYGGYVINAPSLKYLEIRGISPCERCLIVNAPPDLVEANISNVSPIMNEKLLGALESAKRLSLELSPLEQSQRFDKDCVVGSKWNQPKDVPECLLSHLEKLEWKLFNWDREEDIEVATYILRNARLLKNATFSTRPIQYKELSKLEERYKILMEMDGVVRASNSCHLVFVE